MHPYAEVIHKYLDAHTLRTCCEDPAELFDLLYCCYCQHFSQDPPQAKEYYRQLNSLLSHLPLQENDAVFNTVVALVEEYRRQAFREGIRTGLRLFRELYQQ